MDILNGLPFLSREGRLGFCGPIDPRSVVSSDFFRFERPFHPFNPLENVLPRPCLDFCPSILLHPPYFPIPLNLVHVSSISDRFCFRWQITNTAYLWNNLLTKPNPKYDLSVTQKVFISCATWIFTELWPFRTSLFGICIEQLSLVHVKLICSSDSHPFVVFLEVLCFCVDPFLGIKASALVFSCSNEVLQDYQGVCLARLKN